MISFDCGSFQSVTTQFYKSIFTRFLFENDTILYQTSPFSGNSYIIYPYCLCCRCASVYLFLYALHLILFSFTIRTLQTIKLEYWLARDLSIFLTPSLTLARSLSLSLSPFSSQYLRFLDPIIFFSFFFLLTSIRNGMLYIYFRYVDTHFGKLEIDKLFNSGKFTTTACFVFVLPNVSLAFLLIVYNVSKDCNRLRYVLFPIFFFRLVYLW